MLMLSPLSPLPAAIAIAIQGLPPLGFAGFRAHMPMSEARALATSAGGTLTCKATTDPRLRECNGVMPYPKVIPPIQSADLVGAGHGGRHRAHGQRPGE